TTARDIGRPLVWENVERLPVSAGTYSLTSLTGKVLESDGAVLAGNTNGTESWTLTPTSDQYYKIVSTESNRCLDVVDGPKRLDVPVGIGVPVVASTCGSSNVQKWQIIETATGYEVVNAITQQRLAIDSATGAIVQL